MVSDTEIHREAVAVPGEQAGLYVCVITRIISALMMGNTVWPGCFQELPLPCNKQSSQEVVRQHAVLYCDLHTVVTHCLLETVISHHVCSAALKSINMWTSVQGVQGLEQEGQDQKMTK